MHRKGSEMNKASIRIRVLLGMLSSIAVLLLPSAGLAHSPGDPWTAHYMWRRYYNTTPNCPGDATAPEYECTGILLRATNPQKEPNGGWVPEPKSLGTANPNSSAGGVSFSYIRADSKFGRLAFSYQNGFTLLPHAGKYTYPKNGTTMGMTILCAFPLDAATDGRSDAGCGAPVRERASGQPCQQRNIRTADAWMAAYRPGTDFAYHQQCGFDMRDGHRQPGDFTAALQAKQRTNTFTEINELRIATWAPDGATDLTPDMTRFLPIESFFYIVGTSGGLANARYDQVKYFQKTGNFIPIIAISMPQSPNQHFDFHYNRSDQAPGVPIPSFPATDPLPCTLGNFDTLC
jgi:hypothetical protein